MLRLLEALEFSRKLSTTRDFWISPVFPRVSLGKAVEAHGPNTPSGPLALVRVDQIRGATRL